ncbi:hypothetical protein, partial [Zestomonas carbonaria]|uniref:hypothetical protein n=1 Tax=Zestomonas carbonaria TaxID=2762745 RepID=UPI001B357F11
MKPITIGTDGLHPSYDPINGDLINNVANRAHGALLQVETVGAAHGREKAGVASFVGWVKPITIGTDGLHPSYDPINGDLINNVA